MTKTIALVTCWYGSYPWYLPYFIHSCSYNSTIDFIIITDNTEQIANKPPNVIIINKTIEEIKTTATKKLKFHVNIDYPYKLCDIKPAYGLIFGELMAKYDFWGHADIDLVYGDVRGFITDELLTTYDIISARHDYITGSFCLYRNTEKMNTLFMQSRDYQEVFSSSWHYCFDECNFLFRELQNGASIFDFPDTIQSMTWVVKKAEAEGRLKAFFDFLIVEGAPGQIKWDKGRIIYKDEYEAMFYHLIKFKVDCKRKRVLDPIPETFYFTKTIVHA